MQSSQFAMSSQFLKHAPLVLAILDGWGISEPSPFNAVSHADTPCFDYLSRHYRACVLRAAGEAVGFSHDEPGNSEIGHLTLGSGSTIYQSYHQINRAISSGEFFKNGRLINALEHARNYNSRIHILGVLSDNPRFGSVKHLYAILEFMRWARIQNPIYIHLIADIENSIVERENAYQLMKKMQSAPSSEVASISAAPLHIYNKKDWSAVNYLYHALLLGEVSGVQRTAYAAIEEIYRPGGNNYCGRSFIFCDPETLIRDSDAVIIGHFGSDGAFCLAESLGRKNFSEFPRQKVCSNLNVVLFAGESDCERVSIAFPSESANSSLARAIDERGHSQLHIAQSDKYAHVTFFFNGGQSEPLGNEEWVMLPPRSSPNAPMDVTLSADEMTFRLTNSLQDKRYAFIVVNYANADIAGHTGDLGLAVAACEVVDGCLNDLVAAVLKIGGAMMIVSDHGNAENMRREGNSLREHTLSNVPCIIVGEQFFSKREPEPLHTISPRGSLADVAPTILEVLNITPPSLMTGNSFL